MSRHLQPCIAASGRIGRARHRCQRGVAIITAMLVIAIGTITVVAITGRQSLDMQRERNEALIQQARALGVSGERFAAAMLYRDREEGLRENSDSLDDDWAQTLPPVPIDETAAIQGCIVDMQGHFNLNNLVNTEGEAVAQYVEQLGRLFDELTIDRTKIQAIVDWVDSDFNATVPDGAEDDYYTGLDVSYRAANRPMVSISELQLVKGFSALVEEERDDYERLLPHVAALPIDKGPVPVNVNTATPEVIASLSEDLQAFSTTLSRWETGAYEDYPACEDIFDLERDDAPETLVQDRDLTPYETTAQFLENADIDPADGAAAQGTDTQGGTGQDGGAQGGTGDAPAGTAGPAPGSFDVKSNYFQVRIDVATDGIQLTQYTLLEREESGKTRVIHRSRDTL